MWDALANVTALVAPGGLLFISIYNDQGLATQWWRRVKRMYNKGVLGKALVCGAYFPYFAARGAAADLVNRRNPLTRYRESRKVRGMSRLTTGRTGSAATRSKWPNPSRFSISTATAASK